MPLVFAAVVPHAPLLVPAVAKEHQRLTAATRQQLARLAEELHASQPDGLILFTPHGPVINDVLVANVADEYLGELVEFGDLKTRLRVRGAPWLGHRFKELAESLHLPLQLQTLPRLDYGTTVPLKFLLAGQPGLPILPLTVAHQPESLLVRFGRVVSSVVQSDRRRYALVASGDLTRRSETTANFQRPTAEERAMAEAISRLSIDPLTDVTIQPSTCGYRPMYLLLASLQGRPGRGVIRSFEAPLKVGLLTAGFELNP
ncbi:MAG: AmmeMemoRadiSam system protein B [Candidatus Kerfeldbacteria bacterium]|nr:AmmeMemoRadiSam system protein B [Candidatus Kerfeldbacteria bacterium]